MGYAGTIFLGNSLAGYWLLVGRIKKDVDWVAVVPEGVEEEVRVSAEPLMLMQM